MTAPKNLQLEIGKWNYRVLSISSDISLREMFLKRFLNADLNMVLLIIRLLFKFLRELLTLFRTFTFSMVLLKTENGNWIVLLKPLAVDKDLISLLTSEISSFITIFSLTSPTSFTNASLCMEYRPITNANRKKKSQY